MEGVGGNPGCGTPISGTKCAASNNRSSLSPYFCSMVTARTKSRGDSGPVFLSKAVIRVQAKHSGDRNNRFAGGL